MTRPPRKLNKGFRAMSPERQRAIASKGGIAAHLKGTAHEYTTDEARIAGAKGGAISRGGRGKVPPGCHAPTPSTRIPCARGTLGCTVEH